MKLNFVFEVCVFRKTPNVVIHVCYFEDWIQDLAATDYHRCLQSSFWFSYLVIHQVPGGGGSIRNRWEASSSRLGL